MLLNDDVTRLRPLQHADPHTERILLAAVRERFPSEERKGHGDKLRFTHSDKVNALVKPYYRKGWELAEISA